jgi:hypothetical protein
MVKDEALHRRQAAEDAAAQANIQTDLRSELEPEYQITALTIIPQRAAGRYQIVLDVVIRYDRLTQAHTEASIKDALRQTLGTYTMHVITVAPHRAYFELHCVLSIAAADAIHMAGREVKS